MLPWKPNVNSWRRNLQIQGQRSKVAIFFPLPRISRLSLEIIAKNFFNNIRFDLQKSQSRNDHLEVRLADALEELQKRPTRSSSSPNETEGSTPSGDKGQEGLGGVAEGGASSSGKEDKTSSEEVCTVIHENFIVKFSLYTSFEF